MENKAKWLLPGPGQQGSLGHSQETEEVEEDRVGGHPASPAAGA